MLTETDSGNINSNLVRDIIIGMSDGLTVPFALTAGLSGVLNTTSKTGFDVSCVVTVLELMIFGYFKSRVTGQPIIKGTLKVTLTGVVAAAAAYLLAKAVS
jgi:vacuolar iron transporter family protein